MGIVLLLAMWARGYMEIVFNIDVLSHMKAFKKNWRYVISKKIHRSACQ